MVPPVSVGVLDQPRVELGVIRVDEVIAVRDIHFESAVAKNWTLDEQNRGKANTYTLCFLPKNPTTTFFLSGRYFFNFPGHNINPEKSPVGKNVKKEALIVRTTWSLRKNQCVCPSARLHKPTPGFLAVIKLTMRTHVDKLAVHLHFLDVLNDSRNTAILCPKQDHQIVLDGSKIVQKLFRAFVLFATSK